MAINKFSLNVLCMESMSNTVFICLNMIKKTVFQFAGKLPNVDSLKITLEKFAKSVADGVQCSSGIEETRGNLFASLSILINLIKKLENPIKEFGSPFSIVNNRSDAIDQDLEIQKPIIMALGSHSFVDKLCRDAIDGTSHWKLLSLSTLISIEPTRKSYKESKLMQYFSQRNILRPLISSILKDDERLYQLIQSSQSMRGLVRL